MNDGHAKLNNPGPSAAPSLDGDHSSVPRTTIVPVSGISLPNLGEVYRYRDLLRMMVSRGVSLTYRQSFLGIAWAIVRPLATMLMFAFIFGRMVGIEAGEGIAYPVFVLCGLVLWNFFALSLSLASESVVANSHVIDKVYFPRLVLPLSSVGVALVDFCIQAVLLVGVLVFYRADVTVSLVWAPVFVAMTAFAAFSVGIWLTALNVRFRDVRHVVPFLIQLWMYASPVIYPPSLVPDKARFWLSLNPMFSILEGFRWSVLGASPPNWIALGLSMVLMTVVLFWGLIVFRQMEARFADFV